MGGKISVIHLSKFLNLHFCFCSSVSATDNEDLYFLKPRMRAYSKIASMMKIEQDKIHRTMAVTPPDFGEFWASETHMLTIQRKRVNRNPILPGTESTGSRKLIWKDFQNLPKFVMIYKWEKICDSFDWLVHTHDIMTRSAGGRIIWITLLVIFLLSFSSKKMWEFDPGGFDNEAVAL